MSSQTNSRIQQLARGLEQLLSGQLGRLRRRFLVHGTGWVVAVASAGLVGYYAIDRALDLPDVVRLMVTAVLLVGLALVVRRRIGYPMTRAFGRDDIAIAIESSFPELRERLISAVQLTDMSTSPGDLRNQSDAMVEQLVGDTSAAVQSLPVQRFLDAGRTRRVWASAASLALVVIIGAAADAAAAGVFLRRVFGSSESYPRLTDLYLELQPSNEIQIDRGDRSVQVTVAAGADLPVIVRAEGRVPREVFLRVYGGRGMAPRTAMSARDAKRFKHTFRRIRTGFEFHAAGGDDRYGDLRVIVKTVRPPRVGEIQATVTYPAYTGVPPRLISGGAIEALIGSEVRLDLTAMGDVGNGRIAFLESGASVPLQRETVADDDGERVVWTTRFTVAKSDRYQIELRSSRGLENPHPGTYPVVAVPDHPPIGRILLPQDDQLNVVLPTGIVPLRVETRDDYGLTGAIARLRIEKSETATDLPLLPAPAADAPAVKQRVLTDLIDILELPAGDATAIVGDTVEIAFELADNRGASPQITKVPARRVHVVGETDLARRIAGHFRRIRDEVERVIALQIDREERLSDVLDELRSGRNREEYRTELTVVQVGQARLVSSSDRIHTELMRSFNTHLFNRLEESPHAQATLEFYLRYHRGEEAAQGFLRGFYDQLGAEQRNGRIGSMPKTLDPILTMTLRCSKIVSQLTPAAVEQLDRAAVSRTTAAIVESLSQANEVQKAILTEYEALRDQLDEWNDIRDIITHTRSILDEQRDVKSRTEDTVNPKKKKR